MRPILELPAKLVGPLTCAVAAAAAAVLVAVMGIWSLVALTYLLLVVLAVFFPARAAAVLLFSAIVIEPNAIDFTHPISLSLWDMPPGFEKSLPITTSPFELVTFGAAISAFIRYPSKTQLPLLAWGIPAVMALGAIYGTHYGGPANLVYHENRGLLAGIAIFVLASRVLPAHFSRFVRLVMIAEVLQAVVILLRYVLIVRPGNYDVPPEFVFSHEGSVILGIGVVIGALVLVKNTSGGWTRLATIGYCLLLLAAMAVSGRRAATLVMLVAAFSLGRLLFSLRPKLVISSAIVFGVVGGAYLGAFWNKEYGATAQPARAVRSQIDPSARDNSSDVYRDLEKYNVVQTIRVSRLFGVGFGRPFYQFNGLPDLTDWWPLQIYSPHESVLWLWLKMGLGGIAVWLGFTVVLLQRCLGAMRAHRFDSTWTVAAVAFTGILMFLVYATVDIAFLGARSIAPVAVLAAVALTLPRERLEELP